MPASELQWSFRAWLPCENADAKDASREEGSANPEARPLAALRASINEGIETPKKQAAAGL
jgi:hypothetical protein